MMTKAGLEHWSYPEVDLYFFGYGRDYLGALKDFYHLTGQPPLLPRYALGNWWSRYWPYTSQEYTDLMDRFKAEGVPLAVRGDRYGLAQDGDSCSLWKWLDWL